MIYYTCLHILLLPCMPDPRFARLKSDPRFRRPRKKQAKVLIDDRFKSVFSQEKVKKSGRVDKYGRPLTNTHEKDNLKRFYRLDNDAGDTADTALPFTDYARGEVLLESSDEDEEEEHAQDDLDNNQASPKYASKRPLPAQDELPAEIDLDEAEFADLDAQAAAYAEANPDPAHEEVDPSRRLAVVNLDWDHVRAVHLYKICASLLSVTAPPVSADLREKAKNASSNIVRGKVLSVRVYLSEFGKERTAREEKEGPPLEIFKKAQDDEEVDVQNIYDVGGEDDYDKDALRNYQLERLRYYYAIITCDTIDAATHIYHELEGTELERSANVFDLSYVPDDMTFDSDFRDEATQDTDVTFKNLEFVTDALRHSKVKLTWDEDDPERNHITRRTLTKKEIEDGDFRAYLASSSESESEAVEPAPHTKKDRKSSRDKLRTLLLGGNEDLPEGWDHDQDQEDVDMEITFTPGLSEAKEDETTLDKYRRKMREKRRKKKEEKTLKVDVGEDKDDFFDIESDTKDGEPPKRTYSMAPIHVSTAEELALLVASVDPNAETKHFNLKSVLKAEKKAHRKGKRKKNDKNDDGDNEIQADFRIDVNDERFRALHEDHQYAIDPTNPQFRRTAAMDTFLQERSRRKADDTKAPNSNFSQSHNDQDGKTLKTLVESVKRKGIDTLARGTGKRRKV
ncbi:Pre-rRNA-processing protein esf1 [Termitomyces sp. J132]|nr:Pre-rRNA-processing protein esf1 [Termitomyces sp. J132]